MALLDRPASQGEEGRVRFGRISEGLPLAEIFRSQSWARRIGAIKSKHLKKALLVR